MTSSCQSWGPLAGADLAVLALAPHGEFGLLVRAKFDPLWRMGVDHPELFDRVERLAADLFERQDEEAFDEGEEIPPAIDRPHAPPCETEEEEALLAAADRLFRLAGRDGHFDRRGLSAGRFREAFQTTEILGDCK